MTKVTLLAGGGAVYVYPDLCDPAVADRIATQKMVIDVAYPADEVLVRRIDVTEWPEVRRSLEQEGVDVIDTREIQDGCE